MNYLNEQNILIFLIQIFLLLGMARLFGELFRRFKQPSLTGEILVGIILGPTIFGRFSPDFYQIIFPKDIIQQNMLETIAWVGILFFLLEIGLEFNFASAWKQRQDAFVIAITDVIVPMTISFAAAMFLPDRYLIDPSHRIAFALFMATVMTISAMPVAARILHDLKVIKTDMGFLIISALSINDIIGWLMFTLVLGFFTQAGVNIAGILILVGVTFAFTIFCLSAGRMFVNLAISKMKSAQTSQPANSLTFICLLGLLCGAISQKIGINSLFGFFIAGVMAGGARALSERTRQVISQMVFAIFVPIFFASIGLKMDFLKNFDLFIALFITVISISAKFFGAWLGVSLTKVPKTNRLPIAIAHTPGGTMEIVVGLLALEYGLISETIVVGIVLGAVISAIVVGPWLSYSIKKRKEISVLEFFAENAVVVDIKAAKRDEAIMELCEVASAQDEMPVAEILSRAVLQRENAMGTAIEEGIAVPHARLTTIKRPVIAFGRSIAGIEWNSPDGKATQFVFLILTPYEEDVQVQILGHIAKVFSDEKVRQDILQAKGSHELWSILERSFTQARIVRK
ncbi:MAG: cation:proton antiporter [Candidatus Omnitrophica bacterium]|nr:cation:proton antiporter [Candidatus Omnitrophota bacterium]